MKPPKFQKKRRRKPESKSGITLIETLSISSFPSTPLEILLDLQGRRIPQVTFNLSFNSSLPSNKRFNMAKKYLEYPNDQVSSEKKFQFVLLLHKNSFDQNQKKVLLSRLELLKAEMHDSFIEKFVSDSELALKLISKNYSEAVSILSKYKIQVPEFFSKELRKTWISTLVFMVYFAEEGIPIRDENLVTKNQSCLDKMILLNTFLEGTKFDIQEISNLQTPVFQQAFLILLKTQDNGQVNMLIESVSELIPVFRSKKEELHLAEKELERAREAKQKAILDKKEKAFNQEAKQILSMFKESALIELPSRIFIGSGGYTGRLDNGYSWGVQERNIYAQYSRIVNAKINNYYSSAALQIKMGNLFNYDNERTEFKNFLNFQGYLDYRGNLRKFFPFPTQIFEDNNSPQKNLVRDYELWSSEYPRSVLSADRGNIPEEVGALVKEWTKVQKYFDEAKIFFLDCLGFVCNYSEFKLGFHIAFVAAKSEVNSLRGSWLVTLTGLPEKFHKDLQIMGWVDLSDSKYRFQSVFKDILAKGEKFWLLETDSAVKAESEVGKLLEGLLYEMYAMTAVAATSYIKKVLPDVASQRRRFIDLILKIRHYKGALRFRPYLDYCANPSCGLPLSDPVSLSRGYGPTCWQAMYAEGVRHRDLTTDYDRLYFETPITLKFWQESLSEFLENAFE